MSGNLWWSASKAIKPILRKNPDTLSAASREAVQLFRLMAKEVPRVSNLYDVPMKKSEMRRRLANAFRKNADVKDPRVVHLMVRCTLKHFFLKSFDFSNNRKRCFRDFGSDFSIFVICISLSLSMLLFLI